MSSLNARTALVAITLCVGCGTSARPELRDSVAITDGTGGDVREFNDANLLDARRDIDVQIVDVTQVDITQVDVTQADVTSRDGSDVRSDGGSIIRDSAADVYVNDAECNPLAPFEVNRDCQRALGLTQDPESRFNCCAGVCSSQGCRLPGVCRVTPCDAHAGQLCCPDFIGGIRCVPRDRGLCSQPPR